jgi:Fic family protein
MNYIYHEKDWSGMTWGHERLATQLAGVRHRQGRLIGRMEALGFSLRNEATLRTLTEDVLKSSEIEGEKLDRKQVRSSIARRLGLEAGGISPADRHVEGVVEMMLDGPGWPNARRTQLCGISTIWSDATSWKKSREADAVRAMPWRRRDSAQLPGELGADADRGIELDKKAAWA